MRNKGLSVWRLSRPFAVSACLTGLLLMLGSSADAQQGAYVTQASTRLAGLIDKGNKAGYRLSNNKFSLGGGWLKQGPAWVSLYTLTLDAGKDYRFLAAGDDDATDVDLQVLDPAMNVVAKDIARAKTAVVDYRPAKTLKYLVQVRVFESVGNRDSMTIATVMVKK